MMGNYIFNLDRLELLALSDESQMYSGDLVAEMAKSMLQLQKRIAELETALRWKPVGFGGKFPDGEFIELLNANTTDIIMWAFDKRINIPDGFTHWRYVTLPRTRR